MKSKRIALAIMSGDTVKCSMYEGEYTRGGLKEAFIDADRCAENYAAIEGDTHIAVITFPIAFSGKTRVIKKLPLKRALKTYRIVWEFDIFDATSPEEAARKALAVQRNPDSIATVFDVIDPDGKKVTIDLNPEW